MSLLAHCPTCSKSFRVPHADKTWHCKVCDGDLELQEQADDEACPECDEPNPAGSAFCGGCGASLTEEQEAPAQRGRTDEERRAAKRRGVTMANHFAKRTKRLKWMLQGNLVLSLMYALFAVALYFGAQEVLEPGDPAWIFLAVAGFFVAAAGMSFVAIRLVDRQPLMVVLAMAGLYTLFTLWAWLGGDDAPWLVGLWTLLLWLLVPDAAAITRMAKEDPDLYVSRKLRGEHLQHRERHGQDGSLATRTRRSQKAERRRSLGKQLGYLGGVVVVLVVGWLGYSYTQRPPTPDETVATFHDAWSRRDAVAIGAMAKPGSTARYERSINTAMRKYDWDDQLPPLEPGEFDGWERGDTHVNVTYGNDAGDLTAGFSLVGKRWYLTQLRFGEIKAWKP